MCVCVCVSIYIYIYIYIYIVCGAKTWLCMHEAKTWLCVHETLRAWMRRFGCSTLQGCGIVYVCRQNVMQSILPAKNYLHLATYTHVHIHTQTWTQHSPFTQARPHRDLMAARTQHITPRITSSPNPLQIRGQNRTPTALFNAPQRCAVVQHARI